MTKLPLDASPYNADALDLANAVCAKLCHDLAGTLGALMATLELAIDTPDAEALGVALGCAQDLAARLRLYRAAWGMDDGLAEMMAMLPGLPNGARLSVNMGGLALTLTSEQQRLVLNLLIVAASALPRGGALKLSVVGKSLAVDIAGPRIAWPVAQDPPGPRTVALNMAHHVAAAQGLALEIGEAVIRATEI